MRPMSLRWQVYVDFAYHTMRMCLDFGSIYVFCHMFDYLVSTETRTLSSRSFLTSRLSLVASVSDNSGTSLIRSRLTRISPFTRGLFSLYPIG